MSGGIRMSDLEVREMDVSEYKLWDELVEKSPHGTIFHTSDWLTICRDVLNEDLKIYGCFQNDELIGGCSLFINKFKGFFTIATSTCKMTPYGGIVLKESPSTKIREQETFQNKTLQTILKYIKNMKFDSVTLSNSPDFIDIRQFFYYKWTPDVKYTYYFDLKNDIWNSLSKNVRWTIRKAIKSGVVIRKENNPKIFNELFKMTFKKQNLNPPVSLGFFENTLDTLISKNSGEMWIAEMPSGAPLSAEIVVWDNKRAYRWSAASNNNLKDIGSTSLLLFTIFKDLKRRDFKEINLMAANTPHLTKFISNFNPKLVSYYSVNLNSTTFVILKQLRGIIK